MKVEYVRAQELKFRFVAVEGISDGSKRTLAGKLAERYSMELFQSDRSNPFIKHCLSDPSKFTFHLLVSMLYERQEQSMEIIQTSVRSGVCCDFTFERDEIIAQTYLNGDELRLYLRLRASVLPEIPIPDLIIFLHTNQEFVLDRSDDLSSPLFLGINDNLSNHFYTYDKAPMLIINTDSLDFTRDGDFEMVCQMLDDFKGKRQFYNANMSKF